MKTEHPVPSFKWPPTQTLRWVGMFVVAILGGFCWDLGRWGLAGSCILLFVCLVASAIEAAT